MTDCAKLKYGEIYHIAPTDGIPCDRGRIQIVGIMHPECLPSHIHFDSWITGDEETDFETVYHPWYFFKYIEDEEEIIHDLPQWALLEVMRKAHKEGVTP
jgi:hypothetical protein